MFHDNSNETNSNVFQRRIDSFREKLIRPAGINLGRIANRINSGYPDIIIIGKNGRALQQKMDNYILSKQHIRRQNR